MQFVAVEFLFKNFVQRITAAFCLPLDINAHITGDEDDGETIGI